MSRRGIGYRAVGVVVVALAVVAGLTYYFIAVTQGAQSPSPVGTTSASAQSPPTSTSQASQTRTPSVTYAFTTTGNSVFVTIDQLNVNMQESMSVADWAVVIRNSGSVPVSTVTVLLNSGATASMCSNGAGMLVGGFGMGNCAPVKLTSPLQPGQTIAGDVSLNGMNANAMPMQGTMYTVTVTVSYVNGGMTTDTSSISAQVMD